MMSLDNALGHVNIGRFMHSDYIHKIVHLALLEDIGSGDITTDNLFPKDFRVQANLVVKSDGVICGLGIAREVFKKLDPSSTFRSMFLDGQKVRRGQVLAKLKGTARALLSGERVALNFLSWLSGIATKSNAFLEAVKPYQTVILDTRKTTPLFRELERYAVRCGGGVNHRFNLNDMAMIKDNHLIACKRRSLCETIDDLKKKTRKKVEVEVDDFQQLRTALNSKADIILLDNMKPPQIRQAVRLKKKLKSKTLLEASGGIYLKNVSQYAATGVDRISIGGLTHTRKALDISLDFIESP
jgi:nicotinate-nucleotide pyrophosphorylase (carboxylating)